MLALPAGAPKHRLTSKAPAPEGPMVSEPKEKKNKKEKQDGKREPEEAKGEAGTNSEAPFLKGFWGRH